MTVLEFAWLNPMRIAHPRTVSVAIMVQWLGYVVFAILHVLHMADIVCNDSR